MGTETTQCQHRFVVNKADAVVSWTTDRLTGIEKPVKVVDSWDNTWECLACPKTFNDEPELLMVENTEQEAQE